jgi:hypothetical protein
MQNDLQTVAFGVYRYALDVYVETDDRIKNMFACVKYNKYALQLEVRISYNNSRPMSALLRYEVIVISLLMNLWLLQLINFSNSDYFAGDWKFALYGILVSPLSH